MITNFNVTPLYPGTMAGIKNITTVIKRTLKTEDKNTDFLREAGKREMQKLYGERNLEQKKGVRTYQQRTEARNQVYQLILKCENDLTYEKSQLISDMCKPQWENDVRQILMLSETIKKNIDTRGYTKRMISKCFRDHQMRKKRVHKFVYSNYQTSDEDHCDDSKQKLIELVRNEDEYVQEHGREQYAQTRIRLLQRVSRAELKQKCCRSYNVLRYVDEKLRTLLNLETRFKAEVWSKFLSPIDEFFKTPRASDKNGRNYAAWQQVKKDFWKKRDIAFPPFHPGELRENCLISWIDHAIFNMEKEEEEENYAEITKNAYDQNTQSTFSPTSSSSATVIENCENEKPNNGLPLPHSVANILHST